MSNSSKNNESTWTSSFKEQVLWFAFAVLLSVSGSYFSTKATVTSLESRVVSAQEDIDRQYGRLDNSQNRMNEISSRLSKIEGKLNIIVEKLDGETREQAFKIDSDSLVQDRR